MKRTTTALAFLLVLLPLAAGVAADPEPAAQIALDPLAGPAAPALHAVSETADLAVREVTVFKDGHAFVVCRGTAPTDSQGHVVLDELPRPILGTFWPFSSDEHASLRGVVVGSRDVDASRPARTVGELCAANVGARVIVTESSGPSYSATIVDVPGQSAAAAGPQVAVLKTADGVRVVDLARIQDVTFEDDGQYRLDVRETQKRERMILRLDWRGQEPRATADVGMMYVQKGLRWIPSYKIELDGKGRAKVALEATLVNELQDLDGVTANLVIGVPKFEFEHTLDPIALQAAAAQLSPYFQASSQTAYALSNAIMTQTPHMQGPYAPQPGAPADAPGAAGLEGARNEDLFVFTIEKVTLARGERMVVPVTEFSLPYQDVYKLDVPMTPPAEVWQNVGDARQAELARLFSAPKVEHHVRLTNDSRWPLTTAPALLLAGDRVLAQSMMTYTAIGARTDLAVTTAVDVRVEKREREVSREPGAEKWRGGAYTRIGLAGRIALINHGDETIEVEVTRHVLGNVDEANAGGAIARLDLLDAPAGALGGAGRFGYPFWWGWYSWPWWWQHFNGIGSVEWKVRIEPGQELGLDYAWHYYWN